MMPHWTWTLSGFAFVLWSIFCALGGFALALFLLGR